MPQGYPRLLANEFPSQAFLLDVMKLSPLVFRSEDIGSLVVLGLTRFKGRRVVISPLRRSHDAISAKPLKLNLISSN